MAIKTDYNVVFNPHSFVAVIHYKAAQKALYVVLRKGQRYIYQQVPLKVYEEIMNSTNKGSYMAQNVIKGPYKCQPLSPVPPATLEQITQPARVKYYLGR